MRNLLLAAAAAATLAAPLCAQRAPAAPPRPPLGVEADTNSAPAYMALGRSSLATRPAVAAAAFYWASQIDPTSADALYGRYAAELMKDPRRLVRYWQGDRRLARSPEVVRIDSLYFRALTMDPFLYRQYQNDLFRAYLNAWARESLIAQGGATGADGPAINDWINNVVSSGSPLTRAQSAYSNGRFDEALRYYNDALRQPGRKSWLRTERARLFAHVRNDSAAAAEFALALDELRREDERDIVYIYESKALLEFGIGRLHERMGRPEEARAAYGRALGEDLSFYPAHMRMGVMAYTAQDTTTMHAEMDLAAQTGATDAGVGYVYGVALMQMGRLQESEAQLLRVTQAAPYYPDAWFALATARDNQGNVAGALAAYRSFVERAARTHPRRENAEGRIRDLGTPTPANGQ